MATKITQLLEFGEKKGWVAVISVTIAICVAILQVPEADVTRLLKAWPLLALPSVAWLLYSIGTFAEKFFAKYLESQKQIAVVGEKIENKLNRVADSLELFRVRLEQVEHSLSVMYNVIEKRKNHYENSSTTLKTD